MNTETETKPEQKINDWAEKHGISATFEFVPFSRSRNSEEKQPSLNWKVTLKRKDREFLRTDYMQGRGHCPSYKNTAKLSPWEKAETLKKECETGKQQRYLANMGVHSGGKAIAPPKLADVLFSLSLDSEVLESSGFEDWAGEFGYEPDSRKAEGIYRASLEIALKMRGAIGEAAMQELRQAAQDY